MLEARFSFQCNQPLDLGQFFHRVATLGVHQHRQELLALLVGDQSRPEIKAHVVTEGGAFGLAFHFDQAGVGEGEGLAGQVGQATLVQPHGVHVEVRTGWHLARRFDQILNEGMAVA